MKLHAVAIFDKQVKAYLPVFFVRARGEAVRHFIDAMGDMNARFRKHPADYDLCYLCEFDDVSGEFAGVGSEVLMTGTAAFEAASTDGSV